MSRAYGPTVLDDLAASPDPYPVYAAWRAAGTHRYGDGRWIVARPDNVAAVLGDAGSLVGCPRTGDHRLDAARAVMARWSDGPDHGRRRAVAVDALATLDPADLGRRAEARSERLLAATMGPFDVMPVARRVPVTVLARALGFADPDACARAAGTVASVLAPLRAEPGPLDHAADALAELLAGAPVTTAAPPTQADQAPDDIERRLNLVALLHQALDATAGLVASAVLLAQRTPGPHDATALVRAAVVSDPPVQHTVRVAGAAQRVGSVTVAQGDRLVVLLAAAATDPSGTGGIEAPAFGHGPHRCPGQAAAEALAAGVVAAVLRFGARCEPGVPVVYERRANLRIPASLLLHRPP